MYLFVIEVYELLCSLFYLIVCERHELNRESQVKVTPIIIDRWEKKLMQKSFYQSKYSISRGNTMIHTWNFNLHIGQHFLLIKMQCLKNKFSGNVFSSRSRSHTI